MVVGAVTAGVVLNSGSASGSSPILPSRTTAELLAAVLRSDATALSGDVQEKANLGLPSLPGGQSSASLSWQTFLTGTHAARVWVGGRDKQRVALLGELSEADVVHNGQDVWTYTSDTNTVTHSVLPPGEHTEAAPAAGDATPAAVAARVLKAIGPSTSVTVDPSRKVAKRAAYILVVRPRDARSTVQKVMIAIDASKFVPLRVQVFAAGSTPAFQVGFTNISFSTPPVSTFSFHTPAGATTSNDPFGTHGRRGDRDRSGPSKPSGTHKTHKSVAPSEAPRVIGTGWTSVLELPGGLAGAHGAGLGSSPLGELTTAVGSSGERLLHTALINAVIMPDGRTFVGAVSPALLEAVAATTPN